MEPRMTPEEALATATEAYCPTAAPDELVFPDGSPITDEVINELVEAARRTAGRPSLTGPGRH
ncbi:MAG: hypothetical protein LBK42_00270 [Propionibacteriaceae bacterium]|nr:hypothetical protein [Propionibacteriaceae bacterium]